MCCLNEQLEERRVARDDVVVSRRRDHDAVDARDDVWLRVPVGVRLPRSLREEQNTTADGEIGDVDAHALVVLLSHALFELLVFGASCRVLLAELSRT